MTDFFWGMAFAWICIILYQLIDNLIKKRRGTHIEITGEQTPELTAWMVQFRRDNPDIHIWLNGRKWS